MVSDTEVELGGLFENYQKSTNIRTALAEMVHEQASTPLTTENTAANSIVNGKATRKRSQAINIRFYLVRERIQQNHFHIFWGEGKK